jgi:hypothetical protein
MDRQGRSLLKSDREDELSLGAKAEARFFGLEYRGSETVKARVRLRERSER